MSRISATKTLAAILSVATIGAFAIGRCTRAGQERHRGSDLRALAPEKKPLTRGLSVGPQTSIRPQPPPRASSCRRSAAAPRGRCRSTEREEIAAIVKDKPKIDLEINFDYNSADISAKSLPSVQALGRALTNADLKGSTFVVAGHTDAAGGEGYNQELSERRADAIKRYLVDKYGINGTDLVTVGYGKSKLKDPSQPMAEVNRRVQVVNMENKATASKNAANEGTCDCKSGRCADRTMAPVLQMRPATRAGRITSLKAHCRFIGAVFRPSPAQFMCPASI